MELFSCRALKETVFLLLSEPSLRSRLYVAGGIVPWLVSGRDSRRLHGDLDVVAAAGDMPLVRDWLKGAGWYRPERDSLHLAFNSSHADHGVEAVINGLPVSFAPFEAVESRIFQRNFTHKAAAGFDALLTAKMTNLSLSDYVTTYPLENGVLLVSYTLEAVRAAKERSQRPKDVMDIRQIDAIGIDEARYGRVRPAIQAMTIDCIPGQA